MSKNRDGDRIMILRFSSQEEIKQFFEIFQEAGVGSLVKVGDDSAYKNNKEKEKKETKWSEMGLENLDDKNSEKPSLI